MVIGIHELYCCLSCLRIDIYHIDRAILEEQEIVRLAVASLLLGYPTEESGYERTVAHCENRFTLVAFEHQGESIVGALIEIWDGFATKMLAERSGANGLDVLEALKLPVVDLIEKICCRVTFTFTCSGRDNLESLLRTQKGGLVSGVEGDAGEGQSGALGLKLSERIDLIVNPRPSADFEAVHVGSTVANDHYSGRVLGERRQNQLFNWAQARS